MRHQVKIFFARKCRQWSENLNTLKKTDLEEQKGIRQKWGKMWGIGREYDTGGFVRR
jgi:hypothetical protein